MFCFQYRRRVKAHLFLTPVTFLKYRHLGTLKSYWEGRAFTGEVRIIQVPWAINSIKVLCITSVRRETWCANVWRAMRRTEVSDAMRILSTGIKSSAHVENLRHSVSNYLSCHIIFLSDFKLWRKRSFVLSTGAAADIDTRVIQWVPCLIVPNSIFLNLEKRLFEMFRYYFTK